MLLLMPNLEEIPAPEKQLKWDLATSNHVQVSKNGCVRKAHIFIIIIEIRSPYSSLCLVYIGDCEWGPYGEFTDCSVSCGEGLKSRAREIVVEADQGGRKCIGEPVQELSCFLRPCGSKLHLRYVQTG